MIPLPAPKASIALLRGIHAEYEAAIAWGDFRSIHEVNGRFHTEFFRLCGLFAAAGAIIHLGAVGAEDGFERIPESCIVGAKIISDAAFGHGIKRIVFASSIHCDRLQPHEPGCRRRSAAEAGPSLSCRQFATRLSARRQSDAGSSWKR
jgi:nucleoside-diphosphate-sugar epimerase